MKHRNLAVLVLVLVTASSASAEMYEWKDEDGNLHFSDRPPQTRENLPSGAVPTYAG
jgi:hypothetical protein